MNAVTGKADLTTEYAARTINHQLSVLFGLYEHAGAADLGSLVNPVPAQRARHGRRSHAHHNPMEDFTIFRRANYRQKAPRPVSRAIPDDAAAALFNALHSHRTPDESWRIVFYPIRTVKATADDLGWVTTRSFSPPSRSLFSFHDRWPHLITGRPVNATPITVFRSK